MQFSEQEVTLKLKSRPLRLVYLVRNREDLINAVTLYTHVWGGAANAILPIPENDVEANTFKLALQWIDPDYILFPSEGILSYIAQELEQLPALQRPISAEEVQQHINGSKFLSLQSGTLSHIRLILESLYPNRLDDSNIRLVDLGGLSNLELILQCGAPTQVYRDYLVRRLAAKVFPYPNTIEQLIKVSLLSGHLSNSTSLTMSKTQRSWNILPPYIIWTNDEETLCLFLDDGQDIGLATAFWNCRWLFRENKIFLPREAFLKNIEDHASLIVKFMPSIRALFVTTPIDREAALALYNTLKNAFAATGRNVLVKVCYCDFRFDWIKGAVSSGGTNAFSRLINPDGSVRFDLPVPFGHENTDFTFSYDAEVTFGSGRRFSIPGTPAASVLITNKLQKIEYAESNKYDLGNLWLERDLPVRSAPKGVTGIALAGKECRFYIHPDDLVIIRQLKDVGFEVKSNKHTRYAQGFVKRFGGFEKVVRLVNLGGLKILSGLRHPQAKEGGLNFQQTVEFISQRDISKQDAKNLLEQQLPFLLSSGLVRRGYSLRCPHCDLTDWYSIENVGEFVECGGCAQNFQLSLKKPEFAYKPNELANRFMEEGGQALLMTAALFYQIEPSAFIKFGGDILRISENRAFAEVDLFWLTGDAFILAECKICYEIEQEDILKIKDSLEKTVEIANLIDAQIVVLGVVTNSSELCDLFAAVADVVQKAKEQKIGVHLALNGKLYLWGRVDGATETWKVRLEELQIDSNPPQKECYIGESPTEFSHLRGSKEFLNEDVLRCWEQEMGV